MMISIRAVVRNLLGFGASIDRSLRTHVKSRVTVPLLVTSLTLIGALFLTRLGPSYAQSPLPVWADSWNGVHSLLDFNPVGDYTDAYIQSIAWRFDFGLSSSKYRAALKAGNPSFINSMYRDALQYTSQNFAWFQANHPEWLLYNCDGVTPILVYDYRAVIPDFSNPAFVDFRWNTEFAPLLSGLGSYPAESVVMDGALLENEFYTPTMAVTWGHACGAYDTSGNWVQKFAGRGSYADVFDPAYTDAFISYLTEIRRRLHALNPPRLLITNSYPRVVYNDPVRRANFINSVDGIMMQGAEYSAQFPGTSERYG